MTQSKNSPMLSVFDSDEVESVLRKTFYADDAPRPKTLGKRTAGKAKPEHYEVICISLYKEDLERLDEKVRELKARGHRKMSRSSLIRYALDSVDLGALPRSY